MNGILSYFREVRAEMKHVSWPSREQAITYTVVVVAVSVAVAAYLGLWDYIFRALILRVI